MIDDDIDEPEDFGGADEPGAADGAPSEKPSLREIWENNPALKLAALVVGGAVLLGGYVVFSGGGEEGEKSKLAVNAAATARQVPGKEALDPVYSKAIEETNKQQAEDALKTGGSALPLPIAIAKTDGLEVAPEVEKPKTDVLADWRRVADAGKARAAQEAVEAEAAPSAPLPDMVPMVQPLRAPQQAQLAPEADKELAKTLSAQMRVIIGAQSPGAAQNATVTAVASEYKKRMDAELAAQQAAAVPGGATPGGLAGLAPAAAPLPGAPGLEPGATETAPSKIIVPAGSIVYGQLVNELNSDVQGGPVIVQVLSGPFAGGRALGTLARQDELLVIRFSQVVKDDVTYGIEAMALDEKTTLAAQATGVDHHYFSRIVLPAAAEFIQGYAQSAAQVAQEVTSVDGGVAASRPKASARESIFSGIEQGAQSASDILQQGANRPVTVRLAKGTTMGLYFSRSVTNKDVVK